MYINPQNHEDIQFEIFSLAGSDDGNVMLENANPELLIWWERFNFVLQALVDHLGEFVTIKDGNADKMYNFQEVEHFQVLFSNILVSFTLLAEIGRNTKMWGNLFNSGRIPTGTMITLYADAVPRADEILKKLKAGIAELRNAYPKVSNNV